MKSVDIIMHCWAKKLPHNAAALCYSLSSLYLHRPEHCTVLATVCCEPSDRRTLDVLAYFAKVVPVKTIMMQDCHYLGRRSIGRNVAAKGTKADFVWFADVDQCYEAGLLDALVTMEWPKGAVMVYPRTVKIHCDHATGDRATAGVGHPRVVSIDPAEFIDHHHNRAIGGVQIVRGDFAREHGYLDKMDRWQQPVEKPFAQSSEYGDVPYRKFCGRFGTIVGVDLLGMYRLRHTKCAYRDEPEQMTLLE